MDPPCDSFSSTRCFMCLQPVDSSFQPKDSWSPNIFQPGGFVNRPIFQLVRHRAFGTSGVPPMSGRSWSGSTQVLGPVSFSSFQSPFREPKSDCRFLLFCFRIAFTTLSNPPFELTWHHQLISNCLRKVNPSGIQVLPKNNVNSLH